MIRKPVKDGLGKTVRGFRWNPVKNTLEHEDDLVHVSSYDMKPEVGSPEHKKKNPQLYGYRYVPKIEQALYPKLGTAPAEIASAKKIINESGPVKYDKNGLPNKATPEQMGAAAESLERMRQMMGEPDKPKKKINTYAEVKIPIPTINYSLLRNSKEDAREAAIEKLRVYAFTKSESDEDKGIGSLANTTGRKLRAAAAKDSWRKNRETIYEK